MKRDERPDPERDEYVDQFVDLEKFIESVRKLIRTLNKADVPVSCGTAHGCRLAFERLAVVPAEAPDSWSNLHAYAARRGDLIDLTDTAVEYLANRLHLSYPKLKADDAIEWEQALKGERIAGRKFPDLSPQMAAFALGVEERLSWPIPKPTAFVTIKQVAKTVHREARSMTSYIADWGNPVICHAGRRAAKYDLNAIRETLRSQFPDVKPHEWDLLEGAAKSS